MADFSGNTENLQCYKESAWMPKFWNIDALGWSGNPILYARPPERNINQTVWPASNSIDGIFSHELNHNFDFGPWLFGRHMNSLIETHALVSMNFNRSEVSADQWYQQERELFDEKIREGCLIPDALTSKLLQFSERHGWSALKRVMHKSQTSYSNPWPHTPYEQYLRWWEELKIETGYDGWLTLHTLSERAEIIEMFKRLQPFSLKNPATLSDVDSQLLLSHAEFSEPETVGWDRLWRNSIAGCRLQTRNETYASGIYAHAPSRVVFNLEGKWKTFTTFVGIARGREEGSVVAIIKGDGNEVYRTLVDYQSEKNITVDVEDVKILELIYEPNGSANNDWSMWLEPRIIR
ncbi:MAG TPA: NPCBM/NEW2 domain-containing protein [Psychromonas sp.]